MLFEWVYYDVFWGRDLVNQHPSNARKFAHVFISRVNVKMVGSIPNGTTVNFDLTFHNIYQGSPCMFKGFQRSVNTEEGEFPICIMVIYIIK